MARKISSRLVVRGQLVAESPLHVGGGSTEAGVDLALARDGRGQLYVPATGLAGALRGWLEARVDRDSLRALWGYQLEDQGHASFVLIEDGEVGLPDKLPPEVRDGVGIDRVTGAAATSIKYTRAVLPRGTRIGFVLQLELARGCEATGRGLLGRLLQAMERGEIRLGAAQTRGLGRVRLEGRNGEPATIREQQLSSRLGMLQALRKQAHKTWTTAELAELGLPRRVTWTERKTLSIALDWTAELPVMSKATAEGLAVDMLPLVTTGPDGQGVWLLLAGAGIKGALRSQAERILRTVHGLVASRETDPRGRFLRQLAEVDPLLDALFGAARKAHSAATDGIGEVRAAATGTAPQPGRSALAVADCHGGLPPDPSDSKLRPLASLAQWEAIGQARPREACQGQDELGAKLGAAGLDAHCTPSTGPRPPGLQQAFHIAVDRWTGGVSQGALYSMLEPHGLVWEPLRLDLDLERLVETDRLPAVALLLLVLQDLASGLVPLGFGGQRGLGALAVQRISFTADGVDATALAGLGPLVPQEDGRLQLPEALRVALAGAWEGYLDRPTAPLGAPVVGPASAPPTPRRQDVAPQEVTR